MRNTPRGKDKHPLIVGVSSIPEDVAGDPKGAFSIAYTFIVREFSDLIANGYKHVRNIWQDFVDQSNFNFHFNGPLALNHDGVITDEVRESWLYHQHLPYRKYLVRNELYQPYQYF